jgi:ribosomal protein S12 methylthiotransferase accessory factor
MTLLRTDARRTPVAESLARLRTLESGYAGVVGRASEFLYGPAQPRLIAFSVRTGVSGQGEGKSAGGTGSHVTRDAALAAALGEAIERYSARHMPEDELVLATAEGLGVEAVDPSRFGLFREDQYAASRLYVPFTETTPVRWVRGVSLPEGNPVWLPSQLVHLVWVDPLPEGEQRIGFSTSNGTACGATLEEAVLSGLLELVERDAFMLTWYGRLSLPCLDWSGDPGLRSLDEERFSPTGVTYRVVDLSCFMEVPTALAVTRTRASGGTTFGLGASSAPTIGDAWRKALTESFATPRSQRRLELVEGRRRSYGADFTEVEELEDHLAFYADPEHAAYADFLDASEQIVDVGDVQRLAGETVTELIESVLSRLCARGYKAYVVELTTSDVREAGLHVVKVVVPELCGLDFSYTWRFLGCPRLYAVPYELGLVDHPLGPDELNHYPHPFP